MKTSFTLNGKTLEIIQDETAPNPRKEFDNLGTFLFSHKRFRFGDEGKANKLVGSNDSNEYRRFINRKDVISLPVWMYDHSGQTIKVSRSGNPFSCPWDSGLIGWVVVTKEQVRKEYGWKVITKERLAKIETLLESEVETYDQFLTGDVYGFHIRNEKGELIDSCWGFFGSNPLTNGIIDYAGEEWKETLNEKNYATA